MKRGSLKRRLPLDRGVGVISPAVIGLALFLAISVPTLLLISGFFQAAPGPQSALVSAPSPIPDSISNSAPVPEIVPANCPAKSSITPQDEILHIASVNSELIATVKSSDRKSTQISLRNSGFSDLTRIKVSSQGSVLGILSQLAPDENRVLAVSDLAADITVSALDSSGKMVYGEVRYQSPLSSAAALASEKAGQVLLTTQSVSPELPIPETVSSLPENEPQLGLTITTNRSQGLAGEVVGFCCTATNLGGCELSEVKVFCAGRLTSTKFLTPGKELRLEGVEAIDDHLLLEAGCQAADPDGRLWTNNATTEVWKVSPEISLEARAPGSAHSGESIPLTVVVKNTGNSTLHEISVSDSFGEIGQVPVLQPGELRTLQKDWKLDRSVLNEVRVLARDAHSRRLFASQTLDLKVLNASLEIEALPAEVLVYPGEDARVTWVLKNTGEEDLYNVTLISSGNRCLLKELPPGQSVRMMALYSCEDSCAINVTAEGHTARGRAVTGQGCVALRAIQPQIDLKVQPAEIDVCPGEAAAQSCLITNAGNDVLTGIVLIRDGSRLAAIERLEPGEFQVIDTCTAAKSNATLEFEVLAEDSRGQVCSDASSAEVRVVTTAIKVFASSSPSILAPGNDSLITCKVANTGSIALTDVFVISKTFGPLGTIDFLAPKSQKTVAAAKTVWQEVDDQITAEGFTQERKSVRGACSLKISVLKLPGMKPPSPPTQDAGRGRGEEVTVIGRGDLRIPVNMPDQKDAVSSAGRKVTAAAKDTAVQSENQVLDGIANLIRYIEKALQKAAYGGQSSASEDLWSEEDEDLAANSARNYELSIEGVRGSEQGAIRVLDVSASPSQPAAGEPVKVTVHVRSISGIESAKVKWGVSDLPLTKRDMMGVDLIHSTPLSLESGDLKDGYWCGTISGKEAGTYLVLSVHLEDGLARADDGPYMLHWSTVQSNSVKGQSESEHFASEEGMLFIESSSVRGQGEVSIKDTFNGATMHYDEKMKGNGSITLESLRCVDRNSPDVNFTEKKDLVFSGGQLKGMQRVESPTFHGGLGASVTERFNLTHVDKSQTSSVSSANTKNNTLSFNTDQAFDGTWNIQTQYAKFYRKIKADQQYTGSFQTQKKIKFQDEGK
ncbi:MAG: hypothetical protein HPY61_13345 [Methanotrichaceae archaeon]|nr:hypothetical protein [Methanotrichaceae archaeon]